MPDHLICETCGDRHGTQSSREHISSFRPGICDWCREAKYVTDARDYGYPKLPVDTLDD